VNASEGRGSMEVRCNCRNGVGIIRRVRFNVSEQKAIVSKLHTGFRKIDQLVFFDVLLKESKATVFVGDMIVLNIYRARINKNGIAPATPNHLFTLQNQVKKEIEWDWLGNKAQRILDDDEARLK
jgi:hypothetical protein